MNSIRNEDLLALQSYVTAADSSQYDHLAKDTLMLDLTHSNLKQRHIEIRFDLHDTIDTLRSKIHQKTGTKPHFQHLQFKAPAHYDGPPLWVIPPGHDDEKMLGYFSLPQGSIVHCVDMDPHSASRGGAFEDTSLVAKYRMSDEEYDKRRGTLRDWERQRKKADPGFNLAKHAREHRELMEARRQAKLGLPLPDGFEIDASSGNVVRVPEEEEDVNRTGNNTASATVAEEEYSESTIEGIQVGMRCQVQPGGRRGCVAFVGKVPEIGGGGYWVGICFDEPLGCNAPLPRVFVNCLDLKSQLLM